MSGILCRRLRASTQSGGRKQNPLASVHLTTSYQQAHSLLMTKPILRLTGVTKSIETGTHRVDILRGIEFEIQPGEFVAIMGASGSGKSTLLGLLAGLDSPTQGTIELDGEEIGGLKEDRLADLRGSKIGFVFQSYQLIPTLTAEENVLLPVELAGDDSAASQERARQLLNTVGLSERREHYPVQLSGGEQQRVALARAFIRRPPLLLADEPTGNLDSTNGKQILELLLALNRSEKTTLVLVTHDRELAAHASRVIMLKDGLVVSDAPVEVRS
jgi:putative ABC transport system ATP-binding protein